MSIRLFLRAKSARAFNFDGRRGFVAQIRCRAGFPFPRTDLSYGRCAGYAKSGVAVENGDADLDFRDLPIKVSCH